MRPTCEVSADACLEDGRVHLATPTDVVELRGLDAYVTDWELVTSITLPSHWYVCFYHMIWSERMVHDMSPDRCEVRLRSTELFSFFNPVRQRRQQSDHSAAWAAQADDSDSDGPPEQPEHASDDGANAPPSEHTDDDPFSDATHHDWESEGDGAEPAPTGAPLPDDVPLGPADDPPDSSDSSSADSDSSESSDGHASLDTAGAGLGAALHRVAIPHLGWIAFYLDGNGGHFVAACRNKDHREGNLVCKTSRRANEGRKLGQGRPLGWLMCWLEQCLPGNEDAPPCRHAHVHPGVAFRPSLAQRIAARARLMALEGAMDLASMEFGGLDAVPAEPIHFK